MITILIASFLISEPVVKPHRPEPYMGVGVSLTPQNYTSGDPATGAVTDRITNRKVMGSIGIPFQINEFEVFDSRQMRLMLNSELLYGVDFWGASLAFGPEMYIPFGAYQIPDGLFWGIQAGGFYGSILADNIVGNKTTTAALVNFYFGPQFDFGNAVSLKIQFNPKFYFGRVARGALRSEWSDLMGSALFFNAQLQF
jgi:hypothetical protein